MEALDKLIVLIVLICCNILIYYMFQQIKSYRKELLDMEMLRQQNEFYKMRSEETEREREKLKKIRHDISNKYILELNYLENKQYEELHDLYLKEVDCLKSGAKLIETKNIGIDAVVNYKLEIARELSVKVSHNVKVGTEITLDDLELTVLLGNLFDNAIEAVEKLPEEDRVIDFRICSDRTSMLFQISNTYDGTLKWNKEGIISTGKKHAEKHGIGLRNIREIVDSHDGNMEINASDHRFEVTVFLYMP